MINNIINSFKHIPYTFKHKLAFLKVEKELLHKNTLTGYLHDIDKLIMYLFLPFLGTKRINRIHRKYSTHHANTKKTDYTSMIIDWECARITKPDKPMNARQTLVKYYPNLTDQIVPLLDNFNL